MGISEKKMQIVINNYFKQECDVNTSIREAFEKGFRIGVKKGQSVQPEQCEWIPKEVENVPYGLMVECSKCGRLELVDNAFYHKYCPNCGRKVITE